jgi:hypothetical protein
MAIPIDETKYKVIVPANILATVPFKLEVWGLNSHGYGIYGFTVYSV